MKYKIAIVCLLDKRGHVLLIRRSKNSKRPGVWEYPAGHIESGEAPFFAAIRECQEETGLKPLLFPKHLTLETDSGLAAMYLGLIPKSKPAITLEPSEHDRSGWVKHTNLKHIPTVAKTHPDMVKNFLHLLRKLKIK